jgi:hypothetical protein
MTVPIDEDSNRKRDTSQCHASWSKRTNQLTSEYQQAVIVFINPKTIGD